DVLNSADYTEAAWLNHIPQAAWVLLFSIAFFCNLLFGYHRHMKGFTLSIILPVLLSFSFFLIADIDSPRWGVIHVGAANLQRLAHRSQPQPSKAATLPLPSAASSTTAK